MARNIGRTKPRKGKYKDIIYTYKFSSFFLYIISRNILYVCMLGIGWVRNNKSKFK